MLLYVDRNHGILSYKKYVESTYIVSHITVLLTAFSVEFMVCQFDRAAQKMSGNGLNISSYVIVSRVGPDLVFLAGCRMSGACQIRPDMPDYPAGYPAK